jgi:hypothetical protein
MPLFVAAHQLLLGNTDPLVVGRALRVSACLLFALTAFALYALLRSYIEWSAASLAVLFWIFHPANTYFSDALYAESLFGLSIILFFLLRKRAGERRYFLLAAACVLLAFLARTVGLLLFVAWAAERVLKRDFKQAVAIAVIALAAAGMWMGYIHHVESSPEYVQPAYAYQHADYLYFNISYAKQVFRLVDMFSPELGYLTPYDFAKRFCLNVKRVPVRIGQALFSWQGDRVISLLAASLVFGGLLLQVGRREYLISLFIILSLVVMCMTTFTKQFVRYVLPLSPLILLCFFEALAWVNAQSGMHSNGLLRKGTVAVTIALLALMGGKELRDEREMFRFHHESIDYLHHGQRIGYRLFFYSTGDREVDQGLDWLETEARREDVVAATDPAWVYLRTGLKSVLPPSEANSSKAQLLIDSVPVRYLFVDENWYQRYASGLVRGNPDLWKCVWRCADEGVRIYKRSANAY